jgi:hypothetical protein
MEALLASCPSSRLPEKLRGRDDRDRQGFIYHSIVERLSAIVKVPSGCEDVVRDLKSAEFVVRPITDGRAPRWDEYIDQELTETPSGNCLDVAWL